MSWTGGTFGEVAECVLAPNANMMTLDGTNTWVLREPGADRSVVVDPGPLDRVAPRRDRGERPDRWPRAAHPPPRSTTPRRPRSSPSGSAAAYARWTRRTGSARRASATATSSRSTTSSCTSSPPPATPPTRCRSWCPPSGPCSPATPCWAAARRWWRTRTASSAPTSTRSTGCTRLAEAHEIGTIWPGHGPVIDDALGALDYYIAHRAERLAQVEAAVARLAPADPSGGGRRPASPGRGDRLRRRRPGALGRRRALGPCPACAPRRVRPVESETPDRPTTGEPSACPSSFRTTSRRSASWSSTPAATSPPGQERDRSSPSPSCRCRSRPAASASACSPRRPSSSCSRSSCSRSRSPTSSTGTATASTWWGFLIVFGVYVLMAALLGFIGVRKIKQVQAPERAIEQAQETKAGAQARRS